MNDRSLEPIEPEDAFDWYLDEKDAEYSENTLNAHRIRLQHFIRWCDEVGLDNLNDLDGRKVHRYKTWRTKEGDLNRVSQRTQMSTLRVFIRFCEKIDAVPEGLHEKVLVPSISKKEKARRKDVDTDEILAALHYLRKYEYASNRHTALELMWHTAMRLGEIHGLDVEDYYPQKSYIKVKHRESSGTPLKNKHSGERAVNLSEGMGRLLDDYLADNRIDATDDNDRRPLISTNYGRVSRTAIRNWVYQMTRPCEYGEPCPDDRDPDECEYAGSSPAAGCPFNYFPHAIRSASITYHRNNGWPVEHLSDRVNASPEIIKSHYDEPEDADALARREEFMKDL
ncbi:site-specific integrase [Halobacterium sp. CBA1126]|uniref:tyrosine-type recombinase/integrase n=1 Tax=Halobacterium sp. CBA1126 TaxID=2668074 RepID=UPI0012F7E491|nr:site-specific integrase [Halobacterium sp. CBA1126]MUV59298.1 tyrosine-type recombinase/integrase [Halobacterium sp. CBA1126]